jgi:hypothetical protein
LDKDGKLHVQPSVFFAALLLRENIRERPLVSPLDQPELITQCSSQPQKSRQAHIAQGCCFHARESDAGNARLSSKLCLGEPLLEARLLQGLPYFS